MANETRVDTFALFFSTLNVYLFLKSLQNKKKKYFIFLTLSNVVMLSVYPLTISIFFSEIFFLFYKNFVFKNIDKKNLFLIF
jgi:asparagine N-glycosylation enzyme membrane subunit Stt3